jgi:arylsulfate sulfotransferase
MQWYRRRSGSRIALLLVCLGLSTVTAHAAEVLSGPILTMDPNGRTPLAGVVELETDEAVQTQLTITDGTDLWTVQFPEAALLHYLPVLGLKPDRTYTVDVNLIPGGRVGTVFATTPPLPADFPTLLTVVSDPFAMEPGFTLIDCMRRANDDVRPDYTVMVDNTGEVVWYTTHCFSSGRQLANGNILYRNGADVIEMDFLAKQQRLTLQVPGLGLHHDLLRTPHGTYLSLDRQLIDVPSFPTSETDPAAPWAPATLRDDSVVEFLPDGALRKEWPEYDMIDPERIGYASLNTVGGGFDWTHSNAVHYRFADDLIMVSVRHQDAVIAFSRETGTLEWILGPHENWAPEFQQYLLHPTGSGFQWQYHQHAPMWTGSGTILLFDNGNFRASPFDGQTPDPNNTSFSRGVEFDINTQNMNIRQMWQYGEGLTEPIFSFFISDADWMETTDNRLMTFGGISYVGGVSTVDLGLGTNHVRVIETTNDATPVVVFELWAYDPAGGRIAAYRSERFQGFYPATYIKAPNGVGNSLRLVKGPGSVAMTWAVSAVDSSHDAAGHYIVYAGSSSNAGFAMLESSAFQQLDTDHEAGTVTFFKIVAANVNGTSGDEPAP